MSEIIVIYNGQWHSTRATTIQDAISDLYEYVGGKICNELFRKTISNLNVIEAVELYGELAMESPINLIYTGCRQACIREVGKENEATDLDIEQN